MKIYGIIEQELNDYLNKTIEVSEGVKYSEHRLKKRIALFKNKTYPKGKTDSQGRYKYWIDIIKSRVDTEVKSLRMDTKNFFVFSQNPQKDFAPVFIANLAMKDWMWDTGRAEELNSAVESFSADGTVMFKKVKGGYEMMDPANTYTVNQTAKDIDDTPIIERHLMTQSELRAKAGVWDNVDNVIKSLGDKQFSPAINTASESTANPYYEIYERNGEVSEKVLFEAQGKDNGDEDKYVLAKIIVAGLKKGDKDETKQILFAEPLKKDLSSMYKVAHRGPYKGRFQREGLYELLFDIQVRANEISNQLSRGLEWASKIIFKDSDKGIIQNILTDLRSGDIIKSAGLEQVSVRMQGFDQLIADWNRMLIEADRISNSFDIVRGESMPSGTPFRLAERLNINANSLFIFLRQKLGITYRQIFKEWILPDLVKDLKGKDIIRITGDTEMLDKLREMQVEQWYRDNLIQIGPHTKEMALEIKGLKLEELSESDPVVVNTKEFWVDVLKRLEITITGENNDQSEQLTTLSSLVGLETDPVRRAWALDRIYKLKGLDAPPPTPVIPENQVAPKEPGSELVSRELSVLQE